MALGLSFSANGFVAYFICTEETATLGNITTSRFPQLALQARGVTGLVKRAGRGAARPGN